MSMSFIEMRVKMNKEFVRNPVAAYENLKEKYWVAKNTINKIRKILRSELRPEIKLAKIYDVLNE